MSTNTSTNKNDPPLISKPWYREFWAWFILAPLIVVFIVSSITITLAVRGADDRVVDHYYKEGRMINMRLDEDISAHHLSAKAALQFNLPAKTIHLFLSIDSKLPATLRLELSHPAEAALDSEIGLTRVAGSTEYRGVLPEPMLNSRWYLKLLPIYDDKPRHDDKPRSWRLRGEINLSQGTSILLTPAPITRTP